MDSSRFIRLVFVSILTFVMTIAESTLIPEPTQGRELSSTLLGVTPLPTEPPNFLGWNPAEERTDLKRLAARGRDPGVCAYVSGLQASSLTCAPGLSCASTAGVAGCCPAGGACYLATTCIPYNSMDYCNGQCLQNPMIFKCGNQAFPYCYTLAVDMDTSTYYQYTCWTAPGVLTALGSYTDGSKDESTPPPSEATTTPVPADASPAPSPNANNNNNQNNNNININMNNPSGGGAKGAAVRARKQGSWFGLGAAISVAILIV